MSDGEIPYWISFEIEEFKNVIFADNRRIKGIIFWNTAYLSVLILDFHSILFPFFPLQDKSIKKREQNIYASRGKNAKNADIVSGIKDA